MDDGAKLCVTLALILPLDNPVFWPATGLFTLWLADLSPGMIVCYEKLQRGQ